jgi:hypothetical protein
MEVLFNEAIHRQPSRCKLSWMATTVSVTNFIPKKQVVGSWDVARVVWRDIAVSFKGAQWGIKANEAVAAEGVKFFRFPLAVTEVSPGGEAARNFVAVGDIVVEINNIPVTSRQDLIEIPGSIQVVSTAIQELLTMGGPCCMRLKRDQSGKRCYNCNSVDIIEVLQRGELVCRTCAVIQGSSGRDTAPSWENDITTCREPEPGTEGDDTHPEACVHIDSICEKLHLDGSVAIHARKELKIFQQAQRVGAIKLKCRPVEALAASCVLVVCRFKNIGRTEKELLAVCTCTKRHLAMVLRGVNRAIALVSKRNVPVSNAQDVIQRFCTNMQLSQQIVKTATHIVQVGDLLPPISRGLTSIY